MPRWIVSAKVAIPTRKRGPRGFPSVTPRTGIQQTVTMHDAVRKAAYPLAFATLQSGGWGAAARGGGRRREGKQSRSLLVNVERPSPTVATYSTCRTKLSSTESNYKVKPY